MSYPSIYADLQNADVTGRVRLHGNGTAADLKELGLELCEGLRIFVHDDEVGAEAYAFGDAHLDNR